MDFINTNINLFIAAIAMGAIGLVLGLLIGIAAKVFKVETDPNIELVANLLPGANCGGCGKAGCADFAKAVVAGELSPNQCPVSSQEIVSSISQVLGVEIGNSAKKVAVVLCGGDVNQTKNPTLYNGVSDCRSAMLIAGGNKSCAYGCLGMSSCARACPFGAIEVINGLAIVHQELCVGCGKCVATCPRNLIKLVPAEHKIHIFCSNPEKGIEKRKYCKVACIGCKKCSKSTPDNFVADTFKVSVNYENSDIITEEKVAEIKCPTSALLSSEQHLKIEMENPDHINENEVA